MYPYLSAGIPNPEDFIYLCLTTDNHEDFFLRRDTLFYRFNNNIVEHTNSRLLIARLPKNINELLAPWPTSRLIKGNYQIFYINESIFDQPDVQNFVNGIEIGCIFIPQSMDKDVAKKVTKNAKIPDVLVKSIKAPTSFNDEWKYITDQNNKIIKKIFPEINKNKLFKSTSTLDGVKTPNVNFLLPISATINRNRGLYEEIYLNRESVKPSTANTYLEKEKDAKKWCVKYIKQLIVEKHVLKLATSTSGIDKLLEIVPTDTSLSDSNDIQVEELSNLFEHFSKYYTNNLHKINYKIDMIFQVPFINKWVVDEVNSYLKKDKLPKRLLRNIYDEDGYYGFYSPSNSTKENIYFKAFLFSLKEREKEAMVIDSLFVSYALANLIPYQRLGTVPSIDITEWHKQMYNNVIKNSDILQIQKFNENKIKIGEKIKSSFSDELLELITTFGRHIKIISDAPVEWINNNGIPLGIEKSVSRLPIIPGNGLIFHTYFKKFAINTDNFTVLIINALEKSDPIYVQGKKLFYLLEEHIKNSGGVLNYREPKDSADFIHLIEKNKPTILVYYGHGSFSKNEFEGKLYIKNDTITATQLENINWAPPITILGACETQKVVANYLNIGNMFLMSGSMSVLATYFPVDSIYTVTFLESLFRHLANTLNDTSPNFLMNNWADIILQTRRTHYLFEPAKAINNYFLKKKISHDYDEIKLVQYITEYCMSRIKEDISDVYRYREEAYLSYFEDTPELLEIIRSIFSRQLIFDESMIFTSLGSPEKISILRKTNKNFTLRKSQSEI